MVGHQTLNLAIGVRVPASQPLKFNSWGQRNYQRCPFCMPIVCQLQDHFVKLEIDGYG